MCRARSKPITSVTATHQIPVFCVVILDTEKMLEIHMRLALFRCKHYKRFALRP